MMGAGMMGSFLPSALPSPPMPPPTPISVGQLIAGTPCCPVCLEQFDPPIDADSDAAFIELQVRVGGLKKRQRPRDKTLDSFLELNEGVAMKAKAKVKAKVKAKAKAKAKDAKAGEGSGSNT